MATIRVKLNDREGDEERWARIKGVDELNAGDRRAVRGAVPITFDGWGRAIYPGDHDDQMKNALLARIVLDWNLAEPPPKGDVSVFDKLEIDELDALYDAIDPHIQFLNQGVPDPTKRDTDPTDA